MVTLVTGASGFVGSAVVRQLIAHGERVRAFVRPTSKLENINGLDIEVAIGNITDPVSLRSAMRGVASVYHVAADYRLWAADQSELYRTNVDGVENVMRAAGDAGVSRIVYTSSVCTMMAGEDGSLSNESSFADRSEMIGGYKESKFLGEAVAMSWSAKGLPVVVVNPSTPIGPRDLKPTPTGRMIRDAALGRMPAFVDTGLNFVHVDDVAMGHLQAHDKGRIGERYILGGYNISLRDLLILISDITGRERPKLKLPRRAIYPVAIFAEAIARINKKEPIITRNGLRLAKKKMYFSSAKAQREIGYRFNPLTPAIVEAIAAFGIATPGRDAVIARHQKPSLPNLF